MGRKNRKKKSRGPPGQKGNPRSPDDNRPEGAVAFHFDKGTSSAESDQKHQSKTEENIVTSEDEFPSLQHSYGKAAGTEPRKPNRDVESVCQEYHCIVAKCESKEIIKDCVKGPATFHQTVTDVQANYVQIGVKNKMEIATQDNDLGAGHMHHTTNIGGDQSFNVFDGQPSMHDISIDATCENDLQGPSNQNISDNQTTPGAQVIKHFNANHLEIKQIVHTHPSSQESQFRSKPKQFEQFRKTVNGFRDGHYILITDTLEDVKHIDAIGRAPWTAVFDFDKCSRRSGLLSHVEDILESQRSLTLYTWQEKCNITEHGTSWLFMNGNDQAPESVISCNPKDWKRKVRESLKGNISQLKKFEYACTEFTIIVMWPQDGKNVHQINHLLTELGDELSATVIIINDDDEKSKETENVLKTYLDMDNQAKSVLLSLEELCIIITGIFPDKKQNLCNYGLPKNDGTKITDINDKQANSIAEDLEVLYVDNKTGVEYTSEQRIQEEDSFYKGGTLPWAWWYEVGPGHVDIERDIFPKIKEFIIKEHIDTFKPGTITIRHNPGSGGTTLAQRILWELKDKVPCAQVKLNTGSSAENVMESVQLLCNKTDLPVILLMDGEEEHRVESLKKLTRDRCCLIVIYVKRCSHERKDKTESVRKDDATFWLPDSISKRESNILELKYKHIVDDPNKRKAVENMLYNIRHGYKHSLFEFGIEIHSHNYSGLESYVSGFLQLQDNQDELEPFQKVLGMLSLIYYYGQATVPCHFFSRVFESNRDHRILRFKDFPQQMHGLIVEDKSYGRKNGVRICHVLVAKEILDQILIHSQKRLGRDRNRSPFICRDAKENLSPFAMSFITYAGEGDNGKSSIIKRVVTRTFISRDNKPVGENENDMHSTRTRKPRLSAILEDVTNTPPYTKRFEVLKQLTTSFPEESQYLAHLGRLYTICLPDERSKAEECFQRALAICDEQTSGKKLEEIPHNMKLTLMHINHMYGNMLQLWVSQYTPRCFGDKPRKRVQEGNFDNIANTLLNHTLNACDFFDKCREITPHGYEQSCHFIGEISVRLMLCSFIMEHGGFKSIHEYVEKNENELKDFLEESSEKLDELFIDCLSIIEPEQMDDSISTLNTWYSQLFKTQRSFARIEKRFVNTPETMHTRRMRIAIVKMSYNGNGWAGILESVTKKEDIVYIVKQYENNFSDANQQILTKRQHDIDYREWLFAIRHCHYPEKRSLYEVLKFVQQWYDQTKTPYARFYLFILKSLVGFGDGKYMAENTEVLLQSQSLKAEVTELSRFVTKPKYPREWLGRADETIRRLVPGRRFFGTIEDPEDDMLLEIMIGTICPPNDRPASGYIGLDLGPDTPVPIKVFFVPARSEMKGSRNKNARVEFQLGFSMSHGYEAFNVRPLKNLRCTNCGRKVEFRSCDSTIVCFTCKTVHQRQKRNGATAQHSN